MKLESLPKSKETKAKKIVGRGPGSGMGKTSTRGEMVKNQEVVLQLMHGSKVDNHHFIEDYQKEVSITLVSLSNMQQLI